MAHKPRVTHGPPSQAVGAARYDRSMRYALLLIALVVAGCDSSDAVDAGQDDAGPVDAGLPDAGPDAGRPDSGGGFTLLINNYLTWCAITEDGAMYSRTKDFPPGTVVNLNASPNATFTWGYWSGTDADTGSHDTNMAATVTMNANKTVLACCPQPLPQSQTCP